MTEDQWFNLAKFLFYACIVIITIAGILSFLAYLRLTRGARLLELVLVWIVAAGGSIVGSLIVAALGYILEKSERSFEPIAAAIGMLFSIPIVVGCVAGTMIAALLIYINFWRPTLIASAGALVVSAFISGVALVPVGIFILALSHI